MLQIIAQFLAITCLVLCRGSLADPGRPGGCYECEEEVWEEVPCDEIPSNATTTTTTSTSTTSTTTTTPKPTPSTTEDPYKKCYCECKVGCKEFCRKVVVNPEPKKQILQVSKITEPMSQGRLESTHYHQRELIPKKHYGTSYKPGNPQKPSHTDKYAAHSPAVETPSRYYNAQYVNPPSASAYVKAQSGFNSAPSYGSNKPQPQYYKAPHTSTYDFPIPFANTYSKLTKTVQDPSGNNVKVSFATSNGVPSSPYPSPVRTAELENPLSGGYDSVESYIKDIMHSSPSSNYQSYDGYGGHHYSMSFR